jgi:hypothetical protein
MQRRQGAQYEYLGECAVAVIFTLKSQLIRTYLQCNLFTIKGFFSDTLLNDILNYVVAFFISPFKVLPCAQFLRAFRYHFR